jgi:hypothetical protein
VATWSEAVVADYEELEDVVGVVDKAGGAGRRQRVAKARASEEQGLPEFVTIADRRRSRQRPVTLSSILF